MNFTEEKILKDGKLLPGGVLKVDGFLNHRIDTAFLLKCGEEWYKLFGDAGVTKILTIEASGIAIACLAAQHFDVPVVFAKKTSASSEAAGFYKSKVVSFTHGQEYGVVVSREHISSEDRILILDDLIANGSAMKALITICKSAGATVVGCEAVIEKVFSNGGNDIRAMGYRVESLAKISSMTDDKIEFC